jgi:hypothetical protein
LPDELLVRLKTQLHCSAVVTNQEGQHCLPMHIGRK